MCELIGAARNALSNPLRWGALTTLVLTATWQMTVPTKNVGAAENEHVTDEAGFGPESHGLRCRLVPVSPASDDELPEQAELLNEFARGDDITFKVELKNVSDQPVSLVGVRYGESYATAKGKLNTAFLAPHFFEFEFESVGGEQLSRAERTFANELMVVHGASVHPIAPGNALTVLLRPAKFLTPMDHHLPPGRYRARIRYHGPSEQEIAHISKHWPDSPHVDAWSHEVTSSAVDFSVSEDPRQTKRPKLIWGPVKDGLQAAIEFRTPAYVTEDSTEPPGVPLKTNLQIFFHVKNVGESPVTFVSETSRQGDTVHVTDADGNDVKVNSTFFTGWPIDVRWNLKTGDVAKLQVLSPAVNQIGDPGEYMVRYEIRFNSRTMTDGQGNQTFPLKGDWQDVLETAETPLFLRRRTPDDDERAKPPNFFGLIAFVSEQGDPIESGSFTYRGEIKQKYHQNRLIKPGSIDIPQCTSRPATVLVRADGFEEAVFHDVKFVPGETTVLKLKPASPARFRLIRSADRTPVVEAKVRYFNQTSAKASSGPIPMDGIQGPVWATSDQSGQVVLTSLQRTNPIYEKLGDSLYYFYVEPSDSSLAPTFVGPIKAGQDLGDISLGKLLEVHGEVHGTAEELDRFSAEWDQPFEQVSENPEATWSYAVSKRLETHRVADKLTFHLENLRPGKLRIISSFAPRPHSVSHTYGRRDPKGSDVLVEVDLKESATKIVITPKGLGSQ